MSETPGVKGPMGIALPEVPFGDTIQRNLFQTHRNGPLPEALQANVDALRAANPDWHYRLFDDDDVETFIATEYGREVLGLYRRIDPAYGPARADLFRYLLIYRYGGVYLDIKSRFTVPIDEAIDLHDSYVLSRWRNGPGDPFEDFGLHPAVHDVAGGAFQQWHVIGAAGHPFLKAVILAVLDNIANYSVPRFGVRKNAVLMMTGPVAYTRAIVPLLEQHPHASYGDETALHLEYSIFPQMTHKQQFTRHYTGLLTPVVRQPGLRGIRDRLIAAGRRWRSTGRRALRPRA